MTNSYENIPVTSGELLDKIRDELPSFIKGRRLEHTYNVEKAAKKLCDILFPYCNIPKERINDIIAASLLHDITKQFSQQEQLELCKKYSIDISGAGNTEAVIHSFTGAFFAKEKYGINDIVFGSIYNHTLGKENMNVFEKIIFIADYIEDGRTVESCIDVRNKLYSCFEKYENKMYCIDMAILLAVDYTLKYLNEKNFPIHIQTINTRNFFADRINSYRL